MNSSPESILSVLRSGTYVSVVIRTTIPIDSNLSLPDAITYASRSFCMTENYFTILHHQCQIEDNNLILFYSVTAPLLGFADSMAVFAVMNKINGTENVIPSTYTARIGGNTTLISVNVV